MIVFVATVIESFATVISGYTKIVGVAIMTFVLLGLVEKKWNIGESNASSVNTYRCGLNHS